MSAREGTYAVRDSKIVVLEECVDQAGLRKAAFLPVIAFLRKHGWAVGLDADVKKNYPSLSPSRRYCRKGDLEASLALSGRCLEFEMFQNVANVKNSCGGKYDFDKMNRMPYLLRKKAING